MSLTFNFLSNAIGIFSSFVNTSGAGDNPKQRLRGINRENIPTRNVDISVNSDGWE